MPVERKMKNGQPNPTYVDLLDEDKPIAQQKFVCVSFVSPENLITSKNQYFFEQYVKTWELTKSVEKFADFTAFLCFKYNLDSQQVNDDLSEFCREEGNKLGEQTAADDYKTYVEKNDERLEQEYAAKHEFQTNVRGLKIRGVFPSQGEAELRAKLLREVDPNFDVYVGPVGIWMPWEPDAYKTGRVEYLEDELNELMAKKKTNEDNAKDYFNKRVKDSKLKAMEDNKEKALAAGNKLTQTITSEGELVSVQNMNTQISDMAREGDITPESVRRTLFENENVVTKMTDHGLSQLRR
jgi:hypothetical protein